MGQLRLQAVAEILRSPQLHQEVYDVYRAVKTEKLQKKHPEAHGHEIADLCEKNLGIVKVQLKVARAIAGSSAPDQDRTPHAAAELSHDVLDIICFSTNLDYAETPLDRVACFTELMDVLSDKPNLVVKNAVAHVLNKQFRNCPKNQLEENIFRPLAVAIGLRFDATCKNAAHRAKLRAFCELYFPENQKELKDSVLKMLWFHQRSRTAELLISWRVLENQSLG
jgi:hypothetical protein